MTVNNVVPVTLLTGFLGSGKTTLINQLLKNNHGQRIAIVENEFGPANIDGALLESNEDISLVELTNGCVCCSVRGEFTDAMLDLLQRRQHGELAFERIIIETTGLADPSPITQAFFVDENLREMMRLDACICLADSEHILKQLDEHPVAGAQIGFADRIILTKGDRIDTVLRTHVLQRLHQINNKADIYEINHGICDADIWLDLHAFELSDPIGIASGSYRIDNNKKPVFRQFGTAQAVFEQSWNDNIQSFLFEGKTMDIEKIGTFMEQLIENHGNDMLRYKGVLAVAGDNRRLIVQGVHKVVGFDYGSPWSNDEEKCSRLVIIGRNLPIEKIRNGFKLAEIRK